MQVLLQLFGKLLFTNYICYMDIKERTKEEVKKNIRKLFRQTGITQKHVCREVGVNESKLSTCLNDRGNTVGMTRLLLVEDYLKQRV